MWSDANTLIDISWTRTNIISTLLSVARFNVSFSFC